MKSARRLARWRIFRRYRIRQSLADSRATHNYDRHSGAGAKRASPESITTIVTMDSGPAPSGASRNDERGKTIHACQSAKKEPRPAGETGRGLQCPVAIAQHAPAPGQIVQADLLDDLNDAAGTRFDQYGPTVHYGVAIGGDAKSLRHVVIGNAGLRQHAANDHAIGNDVVRHMLANDVFAERRPLFDGDAIDIVVDDHSAAAHNPDALRLRCERRTEGARDRCNGK